MKSDLNAHEVLNVNILAFFNVVASRQSLHIEPQIYEEFFKKQEFF